MPLDPIRAASWPMLDTFIRIRRPADTRQRHAPPFHPSRDRCATLGIPRAARRDYSSADDLRNWAASSRRVMVDPEDPTRAVGRHLRPFEAWRGRPAPPGRAVTYVAPSRLDRFEHAPEALALAMPVDRDEPHAVLLRGDRALGTDVERIVLQPRMGIDEHLTVLGQINSSMGCVWLQVLTRFADDETHRQVGKRDGEKRLPASRYLRFLPIPSANEPLLSALAYELDRLGRARAEADLPSVIEAHAGRGAPELRAALDARHGHDEDRLYRMVALQEELDWFCYGLYELTSRVCFTAPAIAPCVTSDVPRLLPGQRPFELLHALAADRAAFEASFGPDSWWRYRKRAMPDPLEREGWAAGADPAVIEDPRLRARVEARMRAILASHSLCVIEHSHFKRRWPLPDYDAEEGDALARWLVLRLERLARGWDGAWTFEQAFRALASRRDVQSVWTLVRHRADCQDDSLRAWIRRRLLQDAVAHHPEQRYSSQGLSRRADWDDAVERLRTAGAAARTSRGSGRTLELFDEDCYRDEAAWRLRGPFDVPSERFLAFREVPGATEDRALFGWAGWTAAQRARALLALDDALRTRGAKLGARAALLDGIVALRQDAGEADEETLRRMEARIADALADPSAERELVARWEDRLKHRSSRSAPAAPAPAREEADMDAGARKDNVVRAVPARDPAVGRALWMLRDARERTMEELEGVSSAMLDWRPPEGGNGIGDLLYHVAAIEADWLYEEVLVRPFPPEVEALFPTPIRDTEGRLSQVPYEDLPAHLARLDAVRARLLAVYETMDREDYHRPRELPLYDVTPEWVLHHLLQHEAEHRSQIGALRQAAKRAGVE